MVSSGIGAPPKLPMRQAERSYWEKSARSRQRLYIAGTIMVWLMRSAASSSTMAAASNSRIMTVRPPMPIMVWIRAQSPVTWLAGTTSSVLSPGPSSIQTL